MSSGPGQRAKGDWFPLVILTGAGISKESGLDTFRDPDGIWKRHRLEDVATPEGFARNPGLVQAFYNARRRSLLDRAIAPNAAHRAIAELQAARPGDVTLVTQNVDDLHERAGSGEVWHMHGELLRAQCQACGHSWECREDLGEETVCPECGARGRARPDVVWFGEIPRMLDDIYGAVERCRGFAAIGTSGQVYPAAGLVVEAVRAGAHTVELNLEPTDGLGLFGEGIYGPASEVVPSWVAQFLEG
ncbi:MAG: NAD-dependent deacylase [Puniceicoccaceae bacterium]|nr:MAG: NAD-dependent deacylase [Puniceicoccaceae bacterium]